MNKDELYAMIARADAAMDYAGKERAILAAISVVDDSYALLGLNVALRETRQAIEAAKGLFDRFRRKQLVEKTI